MSTPRRRCIIAAVAHGDQHRGYRRRSCRTDQPTRCQSLLCDNGGDAERDQTTAVLPDRGSGAILAYAQGDRARSDLAQPARSCARRTDPGPDAARVRADSRSRSRCRR